MIRRHVRGMMALCATVAWAALSMGCRTPADREPLVVFTAGSIARPMRAVLDSFAARDRTTFELESAGSLETARKLTELHKVPDVIALADEDVFPKLLEPEFVTWHARFARNRIVLAHAKSTRFSPLLERQSWWRVLLLPGVETGRSDPDRDPAGYRALLVMQLAQGYYRESDLAKRLEAASPARNIRPNEVDLTALLETGEIDFAWQYESIARYAGLPFVVLPPEIDLGSEEQRAGYAAASVRVVGRKPGETITMVGAPIQYALSIPTSAAHAAAAERFLRFVFSDDGRRILRAQALDVFDAPTIVGRASPIADLAPPAGLSPPSGRAR